MDTWKDGRKAGLDFKKNGGFQLYTDETRSERLGKGLSLGAVFRCARVRGISLN